MVRIALFSAFYFAIFALALPSPLSPDPSGDKNIGNGQGQQFITGACLSNSDCASGCCATLNGAGICSGVAVANQQGKQGCGFGGSNVADPAVSAPSPEADAGNAGNATAGAGEVNTNAPGSQNVGTGNGQQFITGQCFSNADCASGCCAGLQGTGTGTCSAEAVADANGKTGCGFVQQ